MAEIKWTNNALAELDDIARYISKDSPKYAQVLISQIYEMVSHLEIISICHSSRLLKL